MHDALGRLHGRRRGTGSTLDWFRLNELVSQVAFGGRRGAVYRQIVALAGVRPGDAVLDVGCSSGYLARKLAAAAGPDGHVTGVDPSEPAIAYARRRALPAMTWPPFPLHPAARRMRRAAAAVGELKDLATAAGYRVESSGQLSLLRYVVAVRP